MGVAPIGKYIPGVPDTEADAPPSEMPGDFRVVDEEDEEDEEKEMMTRPVLRGPGDSAFRIVSWDIA